VASCHSTVESKRPLKPARMVFPLFGTGVPPGREALPEARDRRIQDVLERVFEQVPLPDGASSASPVARLSSVSASIRARTAMKPPSARRCHSSQQRWAVIGSMPIAPSPIRRAEAVYALGWRTRSEPFDREVARVLECKKHLAAVELKPDEEGAAKVRCPHPYLRHLRVYRSFGSEARREQRPRRASDAKPAALPPAKVG
jgi:hypothetical protein